MMWEETTVWEVEGEALAKGVGLVGTFYSATMAAGLEVVEAMAVAEAVTVEETGAQEGKGAIPAEEVMGLAEWVVEQVAVMVEGKAEERKAESAVEEVMVVGSWVAPMVADLAIVGPAGRGSCGLMPALLRVSVHLRVAARHRTQQGAPLREHRALPSSRELRPLVSPTRSRAERISRWNVGEQHP